MRSEKYDDDKVDAELAMLANGKETDQGPTFSKVCISVGKICVAYAIILQALCFVLGFFFLSSTTGFGVCN